MKPHDSYKSVIRKVTQTFHTIPSIGFNIIHAMDASHYTKIIPYLCYFGLQPAEVLQVVFPQLLTQ